MRGRLVVYLLFSCCSFGRFRLYMIKISGLELLILKNGHRRPAGAVCENGILAGKRAVPKNERAGQNN